MHSTTLRRLSGVLFVVTLTTIGCSSDKSSRGPAGSAGTTDTASAEVSTTVAETTTTVALTTSVPPTTPATPAPGPVPGAVTITYAGPGGGSGERQLDWNAVAGATGYRVYRAPAAGGPFTLVASFDVNTMQITAVADVVNVFSDHQVWKPTSSSDGAPSTVFTYVELSSTTDRYFRVRATNANGQGPAGATVCAQRFGESAC